MTPSQQPHWPHTRRLTELDGLRGLAALFVFTSHLKFALPGRNPLAALQLTPLGILWGGQAAVDFFFVLSGFVLALPFMRAAPAGALPGFYGRFVLLRVLRIYPAYWLALLFCLLAMQLFAPAGMAGTSPWAQEFWRHGWGDLSASVLTRHILLVPNFDSRLIDPVSWTLVVEMRMSLLLPFMILACRAWGGRIGTPLLLLLSLALGLRIGALHFLPLFAFGVALARHWPGKPVPGAANRNPLFWLLLGAALVAYGNAYILDLRRASDYVAGAGAALLILLALQPTAFGAFLNRAPVQFLGRVSYSFYLLHLPTFLLLLSWLMPVLHSVTAVFVLAVPLVCLLSWLSFVLVERPFMRLSRRTLRAQAPSLPAAAAADRSPQP